MSTSGAGKILALRGLRSAGEEPGLGGGVALDDTLSFQEAFQAANSNRPTGDASCTTDASNARTINSTVQCLQMLVEQVIRHLGELLQDDRGQND